MLACARAHMHTDIPTYVVMFVLFSALLGGPLTDQRRIEKSAVLDLYVKVHCYFFRP